MQKKPSILKHGFHSQSIFRKNTNKIKLKVNFIYQTCQRALCTTSINKRHTQLFIDSDRSYKKLKKKLSRPKNWQFFSVLWQIVVTENAAEMTSTYLFQHSRLSILLLSTSRHTSNSFSHITKCHKQKFLDIC